MIKGLNAIWIILLILAKENDHLEQGFMRIKINERERYLSLKSIYSLQGFMGFWVRATPRPILFVMFNALLHPYRVVRVCYAYQWGRKAITNATTKCCFLPPTPIPSGEPSGGDNWVSRALTMPTHFFILLFNKFHFLHFLDTCFSQLIR